MDNEIKNVIKEMSIQINNLTHLVNYLVEVAKKYNEIITYNQNNRKVNKEE